MTTVLETQGLAKRYGSLWALRGLDLEVEKGEVFGFLGPNGAGKTTFTKCVTGFVRPTNGRVSVMGLDALKDPAKVAKHVGLVPDQYDFYPNLTGRQHLDFYGRLYGLSSHERRDRIDDVLETVRMAERADSRVKGYSHGMKQRICIAQAILHEPDIIFFDEPTNGLDPKGAYELRRLIMDLAKEGATVFLNSHLLNEVEQVCERVAILDRGVLKRVGRVSDLRDEMGDAGGVHIRLLNPLKKHAAVVKKATGAVTTLGNDTLQFTGDDERIAIAVSALVSAGAKIASVTPGQANLEEVFLRLTEDAEGGP